MTFEDTVYELLKQTEETPLYAMIAYDDLGKPDIGYRRECVDSPYKDPVIDGTHFMLAADAYNSKTPRRITSVKELSETPPEHVRVYLRAQSSTYPIATIQLGTYSIIDSKIEEYADWSPQMPTRMHLQLRRNK